jgi:hypothetical protein
MTVDELRELTDEPFDFILTGKDGQIVFAVPIPGRPDLVYDLPDDNSIQLISGRDDDLGPWEAAWNEYVKTLPPKKKNRTKKQAEAAGAIISMPGTLALPTLVPFQQVISTVENPAARLQPVVQELVKNLMFEDGKLYFAGHEAEGVDLVEYYDRRPQAVSELDLPMLRAIYSVILQDVGEMLSNPSAVEKMATDPQYIGHSVKISITEFMHMLGYEKNGSRENEQLTVKKIMQFNKVIGIMKSNYGGRKRESLYPVMLFMGYDSTDGTVRFASPYINKVIVDIAQASIRLDSKKQPMLSKSGKALTKPTYTYLVKSSIAKEKNQRAVEIVCIITTLIEQSGDNTPHIKARTIVERVPDLQYAIQTATPADANKALKRAFSKAWELLHTQTRLEETYKDIKLPSIVPTMGTLDMIYDFPHNGKKAEK